MSRVIKNAVLLNREGIWRMKISLKLNYSVKWRKAMETGFIKACLKKRITLHYTFNHAETLYKRSGWLNFPSHLNEIIANAQLIEDYLGVLSLLWMELSMHRHEVKSCAFSRSSKTNFFEVQFQTIFDICALEGMTLKNGFITNSIPHIKVFQIKIMKQLFQP